MKPLQVYIAGTLSQTYNPKLLRTSARVGLDITQAGHKVFIPAFHPLATLILHEALEVADCVLVLPSFADSGLTQKELKLAQSLKVPIFQLETPEDEPNNLMVRVDRTPGYTKGARL